MRKVINGTQLKIIALISMLIDHVGLLFFPDIIVFRLIGRIAFPIFAFCIVEGFFHTTNIRNYIFRLLIFSLISEIPYNLYHANALFYFDKQNIYFTLLIGLVLLYECEKIRDKYISFIYLIIAIAWSWLIKSEYIGMGIMTIFCFYLFRDKALFNIIGQILISVVYVLADHGDNIKYLQLAAPLALIPIYLYNGKKGKGMKYLFYVFYPLHFLILYAIWIYCVGV